MVREIQKENNLFKETIDFFLKNNFTGLVALIEIEFNNRVEIRMPISLSLSLFAQGIYFVPYRLSCAFSFEADFPPAKKER